jgi:hypothetical protein
MHGVTMTGVVPPDADTVEVPCALDAEVTWVAQPFVCGSTRAIGCTQGDDCGNALIEVTWDGEQAASETALSWEYGNACGFHWQ